MNIKLKPIRERNSDTLTGRYRVQVSEDGVFGELYELKEKHLEALFVFLGDVINEIKGGVREHPDE